MKAKKGMQLLNSFGRLREFSNRKKDDITKWRTFLSKSPRHHEKLKRCQPDIVSKINESIRLEEESERQRKEQ